MSPRVTYYCGASLDGFVARSDGGIDWLDCVEDGDEDYGYGAFWSTVDGLVMGRATYDFAASHPPWHYGDKPCWVVTSRPIDDAPPAVIATRATPEQILEEATARGVEHLWMVGGGQLAGAFAQKGLLDRYVVSVLPVLIGEGIPLLAGGALTESLELVETETYRSGLVKLVYERRAT